MGLGCDDSDSFGAVRLDRVDRLILERLQSDGRITNASLAKAVGLSPAGTSERVRKLERLGVIRGYSALLDPERLGLGVVALVSVTLLRHGAEELADFKARVRDLEVVQACWHTAGEADFVLKVVVADVASFERFATTRLSAIPNLGRVRTSFCLSTVMDGVRVSVPDPEMSRI